MSDLHQEEVIAEQPQTKTRPSNSELLPGEEVHTGTGERIKVWSTQGSPSAGVVPAPPVPPGTDPASASGNAPIPDGIIVDMRRP